MGQQTISQDAMDKIVSTCLQMMVNEANSRTPGAPYTAAEILGTAVADPTGRTAIYLAEGIAAGVKWFHDFKRNPDLLESFAGGAA